MIILDTNIISELMKQIPDTSVIDWVDQQEVTQLFITSITIAEISYGLNVLPSGKRRNYLEHAFDNAILSAFKHRILSFDELAAHNFGKIMGQRKEMGRPLNIADGQIIAIAYTQNAVIATRNIGDFSHCGLDLIDPFVS